MRDSTTKVEGYLAGLILCLGPDEGLVLDNGSPMDDSVHVLASCLLNYLSPLPCSAQMMYTLMGVASC